MSLIIDTSVVISVITEEKHKPRLVNLTWGQELISPVSLHWEIGNAITAMFKRKRITISQAKKAIEAYNSIPLKLIEPDLVSSIQIAEKLNIYAYDAYFLDCAKNLNLPILSLDQGLLNAAKEINIKIIEI